jgi:integrase
VGLRDVRVHDLRRTAASWLAINESNLQVIQSMLNHTSLSSTQVYARLSLAPVARALNDQCERMLGPVPVPVANVREQVQEWPG